MTAPTAQQGTGQPVVNVQQVSSNDTCQYIIDGRDKHNEVVCGESGSVEIIVRNDFGMFAVILCKGHERTHREFYRQRSAARGRPRRKRI